MKDVLTVVWNPCLSQPMSEVTRLLGDDKAIAACIEAARAMAIQFIDSGTFEQITSAAYAGWLCCDLYVPSGIHWLRYSVEGRESMSPGHPFITSTITYNEGPRTVSFAKDHGKGSDMSEGLTLGQKLRAAQAALIERRQADVCRKFDEAAERIANDVAQEAIEHAGKAISSSYTAKLSTRIGYVRDGHQPKGYEVMSNAIGKLLLAMGGGVAVRHWTDRDEDIVTLSWVQL